MRAVLLGLLVALIAGCCAPAHAPRGPTPGSVADLAAKTVALVQTSDEGDVHVYCSGVWIGPSVIITAAHCMGERDVGDRVDYATQPDLVDGDEPRQPALGRVAVVAALDDLHDVALLTAAGEVPAHPAAALGGVQAGDRVQTMGHPLGLLWSYSAGTVAAVRALVGKGVPTLYVQTTAPVSPGNSGGGLFDEAGSVVGVCHGSLTRGQNLNLYVAITYVRALLARTGGAT